AAGARSDSLKSRRMTTPTDLYDSPLVTRYAGREMAERWGPLRKIQTWRRPWLALAQAQSQLGLLPADGRTPRIAAEQLRQLLATVDAIDLRAADDYERRLRHDVMAHIHAWGDLVPQAREIIHLGATSCYVTDNADLYLMRASLDELCDALAT